MPALKLLCADPVGTARALFLAAGKPIAEERPLPHGRQFRFASGAITNVYNSGAVVAQGPKAEAVTRFFAEAVKRPLPAPVAGELEAKSPAPEAAASPKVAQVGPPEPAPKSYRSPDWTDTWNGVDVPF